MNLPYDVIELIFLYIPPEYIEKFIDYNLSDYFWESYVEEYFAPQYSILPKRNYKDYVIKMSLGIYPYIIDDEALEWRHFKDLINTDNHYVFLNQHRQVIGGFTNSTYQFRHLPGMYGYIFLQPKDQIVYILQVYPARSGNVKDLTLDKYLRSHTSMRMRTKGMIAPLIILVPLSQQKYKNVILDTSIWQINNDIIVE